MWRKLLGIERHNESNYAGSDLALVHKRLDEFDERISRVEAEAVARGWIKPGEIPDVALDDPNNLEPNKSGRLSSVFATDEPCA